jgi:integrase
MPRGDAPPWLANLKRAFKGHRLGRPGWVIEVMRDHLRVVSDELPPRDGEPPGGGRRRAITLRSPPGPATAAAALAEACAIFDAVMAGTWRWPDADALAPDDPRRLSPVALARMRERLREGLVGETISGRTWRRCYLPYLVKLEAIAGSQVWSADSELLSAVLKSWKPNSRSRQMAHDRLRALWRQAGWPWPDDAVSDLRGNGKAAADPDGVIGFLDSEIEELRRRILNSRLTQSDLVAWDCLICFGLRPAELKGLTLQISSTGGMQAVVVHEKKSSRGSTGPRTVAAVPPAGWPPDCHALHDRWLTYGLPRELVAKPSPGEAMAKQLSRLRHQRGERGRLRDGLTPRSLRHAFALRLGVELGLSPREAAELMGHSPCVHLQIYGRRLERPKLLEKVANLVSQHVTAASSASSSGGPSQLPRDPTTNAAAEVPAP